MADSYHHAVSSARRWGGDPADYLAVHQWFDGSKQITCDFRHRSLRHHAEGIALCVQIFGPVIRTSAGREIPTRWVAEQHVKEDFGHIPSFVDWARAIKPEPWMGRVAMTSEDLSAPVVGNQPAGIIGPMTHDGLGSNPEAAQARPEQDL